MSTARVPMARRLTERIRAVRQRSPDICLVSASSRTEDWTRLQSRSPDCHRGSLPVGRRTSRSCVSGNACTTCNVHSTAMTSANGWELAKVTAKSPPLSANTSRQLLHDNSSTYRFPEPVSSGIAAGKTHRSNLEYLASSTHSMYRSEMRTNSRRMIWLKQRSMQRMQGRESEDEVGCWPPSSSPLML